MAKNRQFELLCLLLEGKMWTAPELAERLEVSGRTIYRDLDALSAAGIPVYAQRGRFGGIRLLEGFQLERTLLTPEQQEEVLAALQAMTGLLPDQGALGRLSALFRREGTNWLEVDFTGWGEGTAPVFATLKEAILSRQVVSFTYHNSAGERSCRQVEPMRLRCKGGSWYLRGWCRMREDFRLFRLTRIEDLTVTEETFIPRQGLPEEVDTETDHPVALRLRFAPSAAYRVHDAFAPSAVTAQPDGSYLVEQTYPAGEWIRSFLLSFGDQVEVLAPEELRTELREEGKKIAARYK